MFLLELLDIRLVVCVCVSRACCGRRGRFALTQATACVPPPRLPHFRPPATIADGCSWLGRPRRSARRLGKVRCLKAGWGREVDERDAAGAEAQVGPQLASGQHLPKKNGGTLYAGAGSGRPLRGHNIWPRSQAILDRNRNNSAGRGDGSCCRSSTNNANITVLALCHRIALPSGSSYVHGLCTQAVCVYSVAILTGERCENPDSRRDATLRGASWNDEQPACVIVAEETHYR